MQPGHSNIYPRLQITHLSSVETVGWKANVTYKKNLKNCFRRHSKKIKKIKNFCISLAGVYSVQSWKGLSAAVLQGCVLGALNKCQCFCSALFGTGLLCHFCHWADSAYNSRHPSMAVAFCGAACIFVSSYSPLCSDYLNLRYLFAPTFCSVLVYFHTSSIV